LAASAQAQEAERRRQREEVRTLEELRADVEPPAAPANVPVPLTILADSPPHLPQSGVRCRQAAEAEISLPLA
jgi:hypothetical protein